MADNNIELRSKKARNIIGKVPPILIRIGILIFTGVILIVLILMYTIPYPQTRNIKVQTVNINGVYYAQGNIAIKDAKSIMVGQKVDVLFYSLEGDYSLIGFVKKIDEIKGNAIVIIDVSSCTDPQQLLTYPNGEATIIIDEIPVLRRIL